MCEWNELKFSDYSLRILSYKPLDHQYFIFVYDFVILELNSY